MRTDGSDAERQAAHRRLDQLLDRSADVGRCDGVARHITGMMLLADSAAFAGSLLGQETMAALYGAGDKSDRETLLALLADRMLMAASLFRSQSEDDGHSLVAAALEIRSIANGDRPRLFRAIDPKKTTPHELYRAQLRAVEWDDFLDGLGLPATERRASICTAYGVHSWKTVTNWRDRLQLKPGLGDRSFDRADARRQGKRVRAGLPITSMNWHIDRQWQDALRQDGLRYRRAQKQKAETE